MLVTISGSIRGAELLMHIRGASNSLGGLTFGGVERDTSSRRLLRTKGTVTKLRIGTLSSIHHSSITILASNSWSTKTK